MKDEKDLIGLWEIKERLTQLAMDLFFLSKATDNEDIKRSLDFKEGVACDLSEWVNAIYEREKNGGENNVKER